MKKFLSVILALVIALSAVSITAVAAEEYQDFDGTIILGEKRPVNLPGATQYSEYAFYRFVAYNDGVYALSSDSRGNEDSDPYVELYDKAKIDGEYLKKAEDKDDKNLDFYLEYEFKAGETYYFAVGNHRGAKNFDITLECLHDSYKNGACAACYLPCDHKKVDNMFDTCLCGANFDGKILSDGYSEKVTCKEGKDQWYRFVPVETAIYVAKSDSQNADPCFDVYNLKEQLLTYHDDIEYGVNNDFECVYEFQAGETYFINLTDWQAGTEWDFTFEKMDSHEVKVVDEEGVETTVVHELTYVADVFATCESDGCSAGVYCEECEEYLAGHYEVAAFDHNYDDGVCINCGVECDCKCHSQGIVGFFWNFGNFFRMLFNLGSHEYCECGAKHY